MNEVIKFKKRLEKIGIEIELMVNIPWIYLESVNGNKVKREDWLNANHGYTIGWYPISVVEEISLNWHDMDLTFKLIRKYAKKASHNRNKTD